MKKPVLDSRRWFALALLCTAQFMMILDFSIVNVALPSIQQALGFSQQNLQWVVSAYALTFGGFLLLGGRAADLFGRRRVFMAGLGLFSLASLVGGLAQFQWVLLSARIFQGLGAAIVSPAALSLLTTTFKEGAERNRALSVWGAISSGGFAAGVLLGGILTDGLSWRWVWFVDVPIGIVVFTLTPVLLSESRERTATRHIDLAGAVTVTAGLVALVYSLVNANKAGWGSFQTICTFAISLLLLAAFIIVESYSQTPLVPFRIFRLRTLTGANLIVFLMGAVVASMLFILTLYMQQVLDYSALKTGFAFLPHALAAIVAAPFGSRLSTRVGVKSTLIGGMILLTLGLLLLSQISTDGSFVGDLLLGTVIVGFGIVLSLVAGTIAATAGVSNSEQGLASGLFNTSQQVGAALGLAILVTASTARTNALVESPGDSPAALRTALTEGFQYALTIGISFPIAGVLVALLVICESECRRAKTRAIR